jgi:hypothetical protein
MQFDIRQGVERWRQHQGSQCCQRPNTARRAHAPVHATRPLILAEQWGLSTCGRERWRRRVLGEWPDVGGVDFDTDGLVDEIHGEKQPSTRTLSYQSSCHTLKRTVDNLDHHPFLEQWAGIILELADKLPEAFDLGLWDGSRGAVDGQHVDDPRALDNTIGRGWVEPSKAVAWKQRPIDLFLSILPATPFADRGQKGFHFDLFEVPPDRCLVPRTSPRAYQRESRITDDTLAIGLAT